MEKEDNTVHEKVENVEEKQQSSTDSVPPADPMVYTAADGSTENLQYKYDELTKNWQLFSQTGELRFTWCADTQSWTPNTSSDYYRWDAEKNIWVPKTQVESVDEDGNKIFTDQDGTVFIWDEDKKAWFPKIDVNMLLNYQSNYVFEETEESKSVEKPTVEKTIEPPEKFEQKETPVDRKKRAAAWFEIDPSQNTKVYVSNLPLDITLEEFTELMAKYGLINRDPDTNQLKIKLYTEKDGQLKGDGICDYIKMESVHLALNILDEYVYRGQKLSVAQAEFNMRGNYNPDLKPKRRKKNKEKLKKMKEKLFDWRPERMRGERGKHERIVIIKNYFEPKIFDEDVKLLLEYQNLLREECQKCGTVNKVVLYDRHEEGVAQVNMSSLEEADLVIQMMHNRYFGKRQLVAEHWDGKTKYKSYEAETEEQKRLSSWEKYLETGEDKEENEENEAEAEKNKQVQNSDKDNSEATVNTS